MAERLSRRDLLTGAFLTRAPPEHPRPERAKRELDEGQPPLSEVQVYGSVMVAPRLSVERPQSEAPPPWAIPNG